MVGAGLFPDPADTTTLIPLLDRMRSFNPEMAIKRLIADSGYESEEGNRQIQVSKTFIAQRQKSLENITTEKGVLLRMNRSIQSEGAFGVLKEDRQFDRFLTRGSPNVMTELLLLCFGYNMNKLHAKIQGGRCGKPLHEIKTA